MNKDMPEVSIVLPTYNGEQYIRESIESIRNQKFKDWELIVVNDCSTDKTRDILLEYQIQDQRIRVLNNIKNMKLPKSLNIGFQSARGKYYTWTSDDNAYDNQALEKMHSFLEKNKDIPMVVASMELMDDAGAEMGEKHFTSVNHMAYSNDIGACFMYRADVANSVGKYDENLFLVEDYDYWLRVIFKYGRIGKIDERLYRYRMHKNSLSVQREEQVKKARYEIRCRYLSKLIDLAGTDEDLILKMYCEMLEMGVLSSEQKSVFANKSSIVSSVIEYDSNKPVVIYGAGNYGRSAGKLLKNVLCYVDRNPELIGKTIKDRPIVPLKQLREFKEEYQLVVAIQHMSLYPVLLDLKKNGFDSFCIVQEIISGKMQYEEFEKWDGIG